MNKEKILIVGGAGFLGSKLAKKWLENGNKVTVIDNLYYNQGPLVSEVLLHKNCTFINQDAENIDKKIISKFDLLYPFQCYVGQPLCDSLPKEEVYRVNVQSVKNLIDKTSRNQRVIGVCTNSGYGSQEGICTEETPMKSISLYGLTKELNEQVVMEHPQSSSLRLATVWGQGIRNRIDLMVNQFTYLLTCTNKLELFQGNFKRNFVHIDDVVDVFYHMAFDSNTFGEIYNLGQDKDNTSKEELAKFIASKFENPQLTFLDKEDKDKRNYNCSSAKLSKAGYTAKITIKSGIDDLIKFYRLFPKYGTADHDKFVSLMKNF